LSLRVDADKIMSPGSYTYCVRMLPNFKKMCIINSIVALRDWPLAWQTCRFSSLLSPQSLSPSHNQGSWTQRPFPPGHGMKPLPHSLASTIQTVTTKDKSKFNNCTEHRAKRMAVYPSNWMRKFNWSFSHLAKSIWRSE